MTDWTTLIRYVYQFFLGTIKLRTITNICTSPIGTLYEINHMTKGHKSNMHYILIRRSKYTYITCTWFTAVVNWWSIDCTDWYCIYMYRKLWATKYEKEKETGQNERLMLKSDVSYIDKQDSRLPLECISYLVDNMQQKDTLRSYLVIHIHHYCPNIHVHIIMLHMLPFSYLHTLLSNTSVIGINIIVTLFNNQVTKMTSICTQKELLHMYTSCI